MTTRPNRARALAKSRVLPELEQEVSFPPLCDVRRSASGQLEANWKGSPAPSPPALSGKHRSKAALPPVVHPSIGRSIEKGVSNYRDIVLRQVTKARAERITVPQRALVTADYLADEAEGCTFVRSCPT